MKLSHIILAILFFLSFDLFSQLEIEYKATATYGLGDKIREAKSRGEYNEYPEEIMENEEFFDSYFYKAILRIDESKTLFKKLPHERDWTLSLDGGAQMSNSLEPEDDEVLTSGIQLKTVWGVLKKSGKSFNVYDSNFQLKWKIIPNETRNILGFVCRKAVAVMGEEEVTAYFTIDLPFVAGPSLFFGTPGVVLYAEGRRLKFEAISIKELASMPEIDLIQLGKDSCTVSSYFQQTN